MELRHIRYFLAVAEEGNFTRAAAKLGIGQPPLSQQIRDLETEIGTRLFRRLPQGAELTEAGRVFRAAVAPLPEAAQAAIAAARAAARGETGLLRLGLIGTAALNPAVQGLIRAFRVERPGVALHLIEANSLRLREEVLAGHLDLAILRPSRSDPPDLVTRPLLSEPLVAVVSAGRDLPGTGPVSLVDLADEPLILTQREMAVSLHDAVVEACRAAGVEPRLGPAAPQIATILALVASGLGFSLVPASVEKLALEGVRYRRLQAPVPTVSIALASRRGPLSPAAAAFAASVPASAAPIP